MADAQSKPRQMSADERIEFCVDPVFVVWNPNTGHRFEIFCDGRIKGFEETGAMAVINHIPRLATRLSAEDQAAIANAVAEGQRAIQDAAKT